MNDHERAEHTPGPWEKIENPPELGHLVGVRKRNQEKPADILLTMSTERPRGEQVANARLIAAAPDLLAALRDIESAIACYQEQEGDTFLLRERRVARAAIAKATGEA